MHIDCIDRGQRCVGACIYGIQIVINDQYVYSLSNDDSQLRSHIQKSSCVFEKKNSANIANFYIVCADSNARRLAHLYEKKMNDRS